MRRTFALLFGLAVAASASTAGAETLKVAVAQRGFWDSTLVDIAEKQGFFKEAGLDIEVLYTEGGASTLTPLIAGSHRRRDVERHPRRDRAPTPKARRCASSPPRRPARPRRSGMPAPKAASRA